MRCEYRQQEQPTDDLRKEGQRIGMTDKYNNAGHHTPDYRHRHEEVEDKIKVEDITDKFD